MVLSLVIDDDRRLGAMLWRSPGLAGHQVQVAGDGEAGLKAALAKDSDLVILDWMLPSMNGLEACRRLRTVSDVAILMLTAREGDPLQFSSLFLTPGPRQPRPLSGIPVRTCGMHRRNAGSVRP